MQFTYTFPDRVLAMDMKFPLLIVATADKKISIFHLDNPSKPYRVSDGVPHVTVVAPRPLAAASLRPTPSFRPQLHPHPQVMASPIKLHIRTIKAFHNRQAFVLSSAEGRIAIRYVDEATDSA